MPFKFYSVEITQELSKGKGKITFIYKFKFTENSEHTEIIYMLGVWTKNQIIYGRILHEKGFEKKFPVDIKISTSNHSQVFKITKTIDVKKRMNDAVFWKNYTMIDKSTGMAYKKNQEDISGFESTRILDDEKVIAKMARIERPTPMGGDVRHKKSK